MKRLVLTLLLAMALLANPGIGQAGDALQRAFARGMQHLEAGQPEQAEHIFREMLKSTDSARVKLELARALYLQEKYDEAKALFQEVSMQTDTPWRVRDNIRLFVRTIEDRTGYLKFGVTIVSDTNPRNLAAQKEFSIGGLSVIPAEAPEEQTGVRYAMRGWLPLFGSGVAAGYLTASYSDYPGHEIDRLTVDAGLMRALSVSARVRAKAGIEAGTLAGERLYHFPYVGFDAVLADVETWRLTGEAKAGKVLFPDFGYLDANYVNATASVRKAVSPAVVSSVSGLVERSEAQEPPYSYTAWELGPGIDVLMPASAYLIGARAAFGSRRYDTTDSLFGERREDGKTRLDLSFGNKRWRWRNNTISLVASLERTRSNIDFFSYRKTNLSVVVE